MAVRHSVLMSTRTVFDVRPNGTFDRDAVVANLSSHAVSGLQHFDAETQVLSRWIKVAGTQQFVQVQLVDAHLTITTGSVDPGINDRSEEHTSELQSRFDLVCRLLLEKKNDRAIEVRY